MPIIGAPAARTSDQGNQMYIRMRAASLKPAAHARKLMPIPPLAPLFPFPFDPHFTYLSTAWDIIAFLFLGSFFQDNRCALAWFRGLVTELFVLRENPQTVRHPNDTPLKVRSGPPRAQRRRSPTSGRPGSNTYAHIKRIALRQPAPTAAPPAGDVPSRPLNRPSMPRRDKAACPASSNICPVREHFVGDACTGLWQLQRSMQPPSRHWRTPHPLKDPKDPDDVPRALKVWAP